MGQIKVTRLEPEGLLLVEPTVHADARGSFMETYNARELAEAGLGDVFVQDNQSLSVRGVLRGLHFQKEHPQAKLVRALFGEVFDVAVDLRPGSPSFGQWNAQILSAENRRQLYIPAGFAHGFLVLSERAEFFYKCTDFYYPGDEGCIRWDDPELGLDWPLAEGAEPLLSEKDRRGQSFRDYCREYRIPTPGKKPGE